MQLTGGILVQNSNTTLVKVKLLSVNAVPYLVNVIQIQHLLKLNYIHKVRNLLLSPNSNTTLVKVKCSPISTIHLPCIIQIQHLLKLN